MKPTDNLSRNTEAVADSLAAMIKKELTIYSCHEGYLNPSDPTMITANDRKKLVDWCYDVVGHFQFSRQTVASAMEMVDRFLSMPSNSVDAARVSNEAPRDQIKFQLLTIAALYSSIKVNEKVAISSDQFAEMCSRAYTAEEIENMERTLLSGLSWRCNAPTAHQIGLSILSLILPYVDIPEETWGFLMDEMKYLTELAVREYYFSTQRTSTVALAAILNASNELDFKPQQDFMKVLSSIYVDFGFGDIDRLIVCKNKLASLIDDASEIVCEHEEEPMDEMKYLTELIIDCVDFDNSKQIVAARARLSLLTKPETVLQGDDVDEKRLDEQSLDDSMKTFKVSSRSCQKNRDLEGHFW